MSRITPHVPMTALPLAGEAEVAAMMAKLRAKVTNRPEVVNPPQSAAQGCEARNLTTANVMGSEQVHRAAEARPAEAAPLPSLEWAPASPNARGYYSVCRRFSVCSITVAGHEYYEAYKLAKGGCWFTQIARGLKSFAEAEAVCEADARKR